MATGITGGAGPVASGVATRRLRVGVVGLEHYHVTGWTETLEQFPDALEIVALYDPDAANGQRLEPRFVDPSLRRAMGDAHRALPFETDLGALIARHDLDIALVTLPNRDAPAAIARLARAGIHLIVDKPAALDAAAGRAAFDAVRDAGVRAVVGLTRRYAPAWRAARAQVAAGDLGTLITAHAVFAASTVAVRGPANPIFDPVTAGGGILSWLGIHDLDALPWLVGEPVVEVMAMIGRVGHPSLAVEDVASVSLRFSGGAIATLAHAYALPARGYRSSIALRGTDASTEVLGEDVLLTLTADPEGPFVKEQVTTYPNRPAPGYGSSGRDAVADLLAAIDEGREPIATGEHLVAALELLDAAYRSAREGRVVRMKEDSR